VRKPQGDLTAYWHKEGGGDVVFDSTDGPHARDGRRLLYHAFCVVKMQADGKTFLDELEARGFDLETIRFSIDRKATAP
jgi:hypothetical protein